MDETTSHADDVLARGDWFGEEALMDAANPAAAAVVAITDVELLVLSGMCASRRFHYVSLLDYAVSTLLHSNLISSIAVSC